MNNRLKIIICAGMLLLNGAAQAKVPESSGTWLDGIKKEIIEPARKAWRAGSASQQQFFLIQQAENRILEVVDDENLKIVRKFDEDFEAGRFEEAEQKILILQGRYPDEAIFDLYQSIIQGRKGDIDSALETATQAQDKAPDFTLTRIWLAQLYVAKGDLARARKLSASTGKEFELIPATMFIEALAKWAEKKHQKAIDDLNQILAVHPGDTLVYGYLAVMYRDQGRLQEAYDALDTFIKTQPEELRDSANSFRIGLLLDMGQTKGAKAIYDKVFGDKPDGWYGLSAGLEIAYAYNDYQQVVAIAEKMAKRFPDIDGVDAIQFRAYLANKEYANAKKVIDRIKQKSPTRGLAFSFQGDLLLAQGRYEDAIEQYRSAVKAEPDNREYYKSLGWALSELGRYDEVILIYSQALKRFPDYYFLQSQSGRIYRELGRTKDAIDAYKKAIAIAPGKFNAYLGLATTYKYMENYELAEENYKRAIELLPAYEEAYALLADVYLLQKQYDKAIRSAREATRLAPEKGQAYSIMAEAYYLQGHEKKAKKVCDSMAGKINIDGAGHYNIGMCYFYVGDTESAIAELEGAVRIAPGYTNHRMLAYLYQENNRAADAIIQYKKASEINPNDFITHFSLANLYNSQNDFAAALKEANQALQINADKYSIHYLLALVYGSMDRDHEALVHNLKAIDIDPSQPDLYSNLANIYHTLDQYDKGIQAIKKGLKLAPNDPVMFDELGRLYFEKEQYPSAITAWKKVLEFGEPYADLYILIGEAHLNNEQPKLAQGYVEKAVALAPDSFDAHSLLARIYARTGAMKKALAEFKAALAISPDDAETHGNIGYVYYLLKDLDTAISWHQKSLRLDPDAGLTHFNLSLAYFSKGNYALAATSWKQSKKLGFPDSPQYEKALQQAMAVNASSRNP